MRDDIPKYSLFLNDHPFPRPADIPPDWEIWNAPPAAVWPPGVDRQLLPRRLLRGH